VRCNDSDDIPSLGKVHRWVWRLRGLFYSCRELSQNQRIHWHRDPCPHPHRIPCNISNGSGSNQSSRASSPNLARHFANCSRTAGLMGKIRAGKSSRRLFSYSKTPLSAALVIAACDSLGLLIGLRQLSRSTLVLVLFLEGGLGLLLGVVISLSSSPSASRVGQTLFGTSPWTRESEKHAEKVGSRWMLASSFLVLLGFLASLV